MGSECSEQSRDVLRVYFPTEISSVRFKCISQFGITIALFAFPSLNMLRTFF